jgi:hypothetical protein
MTYDPMFLGLNLAARKTLYLIKAKIIFILFLFFQINPRGRIYTF